VQVQAVASSSATQSSSRQKTSGCSQFPTTNSLQTFATRSGSHRKVSDYFWYKAALLWSLAANTVPPVAHPKSLDFL
jgi:hypothetical protein